VQKLTHVPLAITILLVIIRPCVFSAIRDIFVDAVYKSILLTYLLIIVYFACLFLLYSINYTFCDEYSVTASCLPAVMFGLIRRRPCYPATAAVCRY